MEPSHSLYNFATGENKKVSNGYNNKSFKIALDAIKENKNNIDEQIEKGF